MTFGEMHRDLNERLAAFGGYAAVLDERCIVLSCSGLQGLVAPTQDGRYFLKVGTLWNDRDEAYADVPEEVPEKVVELFTGFWHRRGVRLRPQ